MIFRLTLFLAVVLFVSCRADNAPSPHWVVPPNPKATEEAQEAKELSDFQRQSKKDELVKITENSFLGPEMKPLAGRPVLLAAGVKTWNRHAGGETDEDPNMVQFEIVEGKGRLVYFLEYIPGEPAPDPVQRRLVTPAMDGYEAFVWFVPDNADKQEAVVKATLAPMGLRKAFIDPKSEVVFHIHSVLAPMAPKWDVKQVRAATYRNLAVPHQERFDHFTFTYPSSFGVFQWEPRASFYSRTGLRFFRKDRKGVVVEADGWDEKRSWDLERTKWHTLPPDLKGLVTHVSDTRDRAALLTHTQYNPDLDSSHQGFQQSRWEVCQYWTAAPQAGPEDQWTMRTFEEDPNSPLEVEVSRIHRDGLRNDHGVFYWNQSARWTCAVGNIHSMYDLVIQRMIDLQRSHPQSLDQLKQSLESRVNPMPKDLVDKSLDAPSGDGFSYRNLTADLAQKFQKTGNPPGVLVTRVAASSPLGARGLLPDDVIVMVNWAFTPTVEDMDKALRSIPVDGSLTVLFWHQGSYRWLEWDEKTGE